MILRYNDYFSVTRRANRLAAKINLKFILYCLFSAMFLSDESRSIQERYNANYFVLHFLLGIELGLLL